MKIKRILCKPCAEGLRNSGQYKVESLYGATAKGTCFKCKRRRFTQFYFVEKIHILKRGNTNEK